VSTVIFLIYFLLSVEGMYLYCSFVVIYLLAKARISLPFVMAVNRDNL
jgi:ribonucleotide reductase beta subunit family protein with ferritin-like domain